jgi:hypothetical protein
MKIGLIPMAGKPVHAGHWGLITLAANENDSVKVFVSTGDRGEIKGADMMKVWRLFLVPELPSNVETVFVNVPVKSVYDELTEANSMGSKDIFSVYSDVEDILKYRKESLKKAAPDLYNNKQIKLRGVERSSTVDVSGTEMRSLLSSGKVKDKKKFISLLPKEVHVQGDAIYNILKKQTNESLLRRFVNELLTSG